MLNSWLAMLCLICLSTAATTATASAAMATPWSNETWWVYDLMRQLHAEQLLTDEEYASVRYEATPEWADFNLATANALNRSNGASSQALNNLDLLYAYFSSGLRITKVEVSRKKFEPTRSLDYAISGRALLRAMLELESTHWAYSVFPALLEYADAEAFHPEFFERNPRLLRAQFARPMLDMIGCLYVEKDKDQETVRRSVEVLLMIARSEFSRETAMLWYANPWAEGNRADSHIQYVIEDSEWAAARLDAPIFHPRVHEGHWSRVVLNELITMGLLTGYEPEHFDAPGITTYEVAEAILQLLDTLDAGKGNEFDRLIGLALSQEFTEDVANVREDPDFYRPLSLQPTLEH